jgi:hypothetical protein
MGDDDVLKCCFRSGTEDPGGESESVIPLDQRTDHGPHFRNLLLHRGLGGRRRVSALAGEEHHRSEAEGGEELPEGQMHGVLEPEARTR